MSEKKQKKPSYAQLEHDYRMAMAAFRSASAERDKYKATLELLGTTLRPFVCPELDQDNG